MKKHLLFVLLFSFSTYIFSQNKQGVATYEITRKLEIKGIKGIDFPDEQKTLRKLTFKDSISLYEVIRKESEVTQNNGFSFHFIEPENQLFIDRTNNIAKEKTDFLGKTFLIQSEYKPTKWHKTSEVKKIGDYFCQLATFRDTSKTIQAWFTPQIPVAVGPEKYGDLPGLIVLLIVDEGKTIFSLKDIEFKQIEEIKPPTKGKKVTQEEYDKIVEEKMKSRGGIFEFYKED